MNVSLFIEMSAARLWALSGSQGAETELERGPDGRLTPASRLKALAALRELIQKTSRLSRPKALCAIGARGVSLRRAIFPAANGEELARLARLRIETEFPLPPEELAWGYRALDAVENGGPPRQDVLLAAVRKEAVQESDDLIREAGADALFTVAALARAGLCPPTPMSFAMLNLGAAESELALFDHGSPSALRALPGANGGMKAVADAIDVKRAGDKLFVSGPAADAFARSGVAGAGCEAIALDSGPGRTAATLGMKRSLEGRAPAPLLLRVDTVHETEIKVRRTPWKWAGIAGALLLCLLLAPHFEALVGKPVLEHRIAGVEAQRGRLAAIDRAQGFLQHLKRSQPPYIEALYLIAASSPQGAKLDAISMARTGEVSLRGSMRDGQMLNDFRTKLVASGFFTNVVIDEQVPTPDRQKVNYRITTQWRPEDARSLLSIGPFLGTDSKTNAPATNAPAAIATNGVAPATNASPATNVVAVTNAAPAPEAPPGRERRSPPPDSPPGANPPVKEAK